MARPRLAVKKEVEDAFAFGTAHGERTQAWNLRTLYVRGLPTHGRVIEEAKRHEKVQHIYLAAWDSYIPNREKEWQALALCFLLNANREYHVTLDIPQEHILELVNYGALLKEKRFIPILSVPLRDFAKYRERIYLRVDDKDNEEIWTTDACRAFRTVDQVG